jgi:hypothetical protein
MIQSVEQVVRSYRAASAVMRRKYNTPERARQFLIKAGILEKIPNPKTASGWPNPTANRSTH